MKKILLIALLFTSLIASAKVRFYDRTTYLEIRGYQNEYICLTKGSGYVVARSPYDSALIRISTSQTPALIIYEFYRSNTDTPASTSTNNLITIISGYLESGSTTIAATQSGTWTVQPGNTANTTAWKVDGSAVTQPVSVSSLPTHAVTQSGSWTLASGTVTTTNTGYYVTGYTYTHINSATTTNVFSGPGTLHSITIGKSGTAFVLTVYDNTSGSGTIFTVTGQSQPITLIFDAVLTTGCTIVSTATVAGDATIMWKQP